MRTVRWGRRRPWDRVPAAAVAAAVALALPGPAAAASVERQVVLMGTRLALSVEADGRGAALAATESALAALEATEARLSTWQEGSELARLNATPPGEPFALSVALAGELAAAWRCAEASGGAFDPTVGALVRAWGMRDGGRVPTPSALAAARAATGSGLLALDGPTAVRRHAGVLVEEGAFGKGAGLDAALAAVAGRIAFARLDFGGQVALGGERRESAIAIADPDDRGQAVVTARIDAGSLATSGNGTRGLEIDGRRIGHLLDPRTGEPAPDFGSLTVWAPTALAADCLATGLYVLGPLGALAFVERHPEIGVLVLERRPGGGLAARAAGALAGRITSLSPRVAVESEASPLTDAAAPAGLSARSNSR